MTSVSCRSLAYSHSSLPPGVDVDVDDDDDVYDDVHHRDNDWHYTDVDIIMTMIDRLAFA